MKKIFLADGQVGKEICNWLLQHFRQDIGLIVVYADNDIKCLAENVGVPCEIFRTEQDLINNIFNKKIEFDRGFLLWWPCIISSDLIALPQHGFINTHPSFLPHNRGKHYNFWALIEQVPFGVSLHMVEPGIDCGDIVAQKRISYGWEDTGETLYNKALAAMLELFKFAYPIIRTGKIQLIPQNFNGGSFHYAKELEAACRIDLDKPYRARDFLNLLRARTFPGHPACSFCDDEVEYEVRVEIRRKVK